jgi:hypothetical protein
LSCREPKPAPGENKIVYDSGAIFPDYEKISFNIYEMSSEAKLDEATAQKNLSSLLGYAGSGKFNMKEPLRENGTLWYRSPADPSAVLNINLNNGDITLNAGMKDFAGDNSTPGLLKNESASEMAKKHLTQLGLLNNDQKDYTIAHVGGINMGSNDEKNKSVVFEKFTTVRFDRVLNGIPVEGHSRIIVQMAQEGKLVGLVKQWAPFNPRAVQPAEITSRDSLKRSIEQHMQSENTQATRIVVKKIDLIYFDGGRGLIEPAIRAQCETFYKGTGRDTTTKMFTYDIIEPLLKNPRQTYSFMHERFRGPAMKNDDNASKEIVPRGRDEVQRSDTIQR